jgi:ATP-binding cassette subfamily B (MDR/TAP) protein 8
MPWRALYLLLKPYWYLLLGAIVSALVVAWLNIIIPRLLGDIVQVVSLFTSGSTTASFTSSIRDPAVRLMSVYSFQGK